VRQTISVCNQRLYLMRQLRRQGLSLDCSNLVFDYLFMSRLIYASEAYINLDIIRESKTKFKQSSIASPSWSGYLNVECLSTIKQKLFTKSVKWAVTSKSYQAADIFADRDEKLFSAMCTWTNHCLHHLLPSERDTRHNLSQDILISWFVIILALLGVALLFVSSYVVRFTVTL